MRDMGVSYIYSIESTCFYTCIESYYIITLMLTILTYSLQKPMKHIREDLVVQDLHTQQQQQGTESSLPGRHGEQQQQHHYELSEQQHDDNDDNKARSLAQHILEELVPLPTPIKTLLGKLLIRLAGDVQELVHFVRRQFDAVVGVIRGRIAEHRTVLLFDDGHEHEEQQQDEEMEL